MFAYAGLVLWIGWRASHGPKGARAFMLGERSIPAWAALCSLIATELSAATFLGVPHAAYTGDWSYLQFLLGSIVGRLIIATWLLGLYFKLDLVTVYGLLGVRFGPRSQRLAAWLFLIGRVLASGVRLFIAALAFASLTGFSIELSIVLAGLVAGLYTRAGGIRAVIWTDVLQGAVFLLAALAVLGTILGFLGPAGVGATIEAAGDKLTIIRWPSSLPEGTSSELLWSRLAAGWRHFVDAYLGQAGVLPSSLVGGVFLTLAAQGTDQDLVQRLLTTRDARGGSRALIASGFLNVPIVALFLAVGTGLWALHEPALALVEPSRFPPPADPKQVLPSFALAHLPAGLRGLVFAGLFAAAMSSLDSAVNALATSWTVDIRGTRSSGGAAEPSPTTLRRATVVFTILLVLAALLFVYYERLASAGGGLNLVELALAAMSVVYGGLLGSFLVALVTPARGRDGSVCAGMLIGAAVGVALFLQPLWLTRVVITWPWWIAIAATVSFSIGALPRQSATSASS